MVSTGKNKLIQNLLKNLLAWLAAALILVPVALIILNAFKGDGETLSMSFALPRTWQFSNFATVIEKGKLVRSFLNSMLEQPEDLNITYSKDGKEIYEDEYMELLGSCSENLEEVIFATKMPDGVMEIDPLWLAAEGKTSAGMTYDEAVQKLGE